MSSIAPIVSIIMPMKNARSWVKETILSIQEQTFIDWELIVVNDHSTDDSEIIVQKLQQEDLRIKFFENQSLGIIPALQLGLKHSTGKYITRMDADDILPKNRLQWMVNALNTNDQKTVVTGKVNYFSQDKVSDGYLKYEHWLNDRIELQDHFEHIFRECVVASPNWMARKENLITDQIFVDLKYPEDYDMCFRWLEKGYSIVAINKVTLFWREHPNRTSRNSTIYDQTSFFELKANWFMHLYPDIKSVGIVGMGQKGKLLAQLFHAKNYPFNVYDLNAEKLTERIFSKQIQASSMLVDEIILVARYPKNLTEVERYLHQFGYTIGKNAFWV